jgi:haloalkane dehalogenase
MEILRTPDSCFGDLPDFPYQPHYSELQDLFARFSIGNTGLPTGDHALPEAFFAWRKFSQEDPEFDTGMICNEFGQGDLSQAEQDSYRAPFPTNAHKTGARAFPMLVPASPDDPAATANRAAWEVLSQWEKPVLLCFSDGDPVTAGGDNVFREQVPGAQGQPHITLHGGHFVNQRMANAGRRLS